MPTSTRARYTPQFKFQVVMEAIKRENATQVARQHTIDWGILNKWKRLFLANGHQVFETIPDREKTQLRNKIEKLEQMVGRKEVELALLKNFADFYGSKSM